MKKNIKEQSDHVSLFRLDKRVVVLTGGAGFLGRQYVEALSYAGAHVIIWDLKERKLLDEYGLSLKKSGILADITQIDITNEKAVQKAVSAVMRKYKRIDALINNAAMNPKAGSDEAKASFVPYERYSIELWERELKVNLTGTMICTKAIAPIMMKQKSGSIVNIASDVAVIAHDNRIYDDPEKFKSIAYATSKTAILGFTRQWAARLGRHNVRVNALSPGGMQGEALPPKFASRLGDANMFGRMAQPGEYNGVIIFLVSDASSFMTGANLIADGGKSAW